MSVAIPFAILLSSWALVCWLNHRGLDKPRCTCWTGNHICEVHPPDWMNKP